MNKCLIIIIYCCVAFSCKNHCETLGTKPDEQEVLLYSIEEGSTNNVTTKSHELVITNYKNHSFTSKELYNIAQKYLDTVPNRKLISRVQFFGQEVNGCMPDVKYSQKGLMKKAIIAFGFSNVFEIKENVKDIKLHDIFIYKDGKTTSYYHDDNNFDSLLNSTVPLNNGD